jgi:hypothetical protein
MMYKGKRYIECTECFYCGVLLHCGVVCMHEKARLKNGNKRKRVFKTYFEMRNPGGDCGLEAKLFEVPK